MSKQVIAEQDFFWFLHHIVRKDTQIDDIASTILMSAPFQKNKTIDQGLVLQSAIAHAQPNWGIIARRAAISLYKTKGEQRRFLSVFDNKINNIMEDDIAVVDTQLVTHKIIRNKDGTSYRDIDRDELFYARIGDLDAQEALDKGNKIYETFAQTLALKALHDNGMHITFLDPHGHNSEMALTFYEKRIMNKEEITQKPKTGFFHRLGRILRSDFKIDSIE